MSRQLAFYRPRLRSIKPSALLFLPALGRIISLILPPWVAPFSILSSPAHGGNIRADQGKDGWTSNEMEEFLLLIRAAKTEVLRTDREMERSRKDKQFRDSKQEFTIRF